MPRISIKFSSKTKTKERTSKKDFSFELRTKKNYLLDKITKYLLKLDIFNYPDVYQWIVLLIVVISG